MITINSAAAGVRDRLAAFLGYSHAGQRDLYKAFGYSRVVTSEDMYKLYERDGIASRIIRAFPQATWRDCPVIRDEAGDSAEKTDENGKKNESYSPFVEAVEDFFDKWKILRMLERADRLSSIGRYGILVMGFMDGQRLDTPLAPGKKALLYMSPYMEMNVTINKWDTNEQSPRYGLPEIYNVNNQPLQTTEGSSMPVRSFTVHHTRVIHLSEFLDQDEVFGIPRLMPTINRLMDLEKVVGGSAECFWLTANRGVALWADKDVKLDATAKAAAKTNLEDYQHGLTRTMIGQGMTAQVLGSEDPDPGPNAEKLLDLIAGSQGMPKRILVGSERGELASSQDEMNWGVRIKERREIYATPMILRPFVNKLIETGNLPAPQGKWWVEWPEASEVGPLQEAEIMSKKAASLAAYVGAVGADIVVPHEEFRTDFLGMSPMSEYALRETELPEDDEVDEGEPAVGPDGKPLEPKMGPDGKPLPAAVDTGEGGGDQAQKALAAEGAVQDAALNGTQISSLMEIVKAVVEKQLPEEAAIQLILISFPTITQERAMQLLAPLRNFEPKPAEPPMGPDGKPIIPPAPGEAGKDEEDEEPIPDGIKPEPTVNATPRPLYIQRKVNNAKDIRKWAEDAGFKDVEVDLHVTVAASRTPVDWMKLQASWSEDQNGNLMVHPGGPRMLEVFGHINKKRCVALLFTMSDLQYRHAQVLMEGGSWDYPEYQPHITITYTVPDNMTNDTLMDIEPWRGAIALGPEIFEEFVVDARPSD